MPRYSWLSSLGWSEPSQAPLRVQAHRHQQQRQHVTDVRSHEDCSAAMQAPASMTHHDWSSFLAGPQARSSSSSSSMAKEVKAVFTSGLSIVVFGRFLYQKCGSCLEEREDEGKRRASNKRRLLKYDKDSLQAQEKEGQVQVARHSAVVAPPPPRGVGE
mmetsp:Transcript_18244/g.42682  ORF Transcript_18244/g.42682 Transcript_18244/m.42682 type:complete len:159 (+) Transcript_18244:86-562(+)